MFLQLLLVLQPFVVGDLEGQLGNQLFTIAATVSVALDHGAQPVFPDLEQKATYNIPMNRKTLFSHLLTHISCPVRSCYREPHFHYAPIPYRPYMKIQGYFQSEKYFIHHKREILELFAPSNEIIRYLERHYSDLLTHPRSVAIHVRFYHEDPEQICHIAPRRDYFEKAIALFSEESLFVVFSNQMQKCKELLSGISGTFCFIEGELDYHDLYLMSRCRDQIISNSSFSWWAAYLNPNPNKVVIAPDPWFNPAYGLDTKDLIPSDWIILH